MEKTKILKLIFYGELLKNEEKKNFKLIFYGEPSLNRPWSRYRG